VCCRKAKLYKFTSDEWRERGLGMARIMQHKTSKKCRFLMRREQTMKICGNFFIVPSIELKEHNGSDKAWVFTAIDFSDEDGTATFEATPSMLAIKFGNNEKATAFKKSFDEAKEVMAGLGTSGGEGESEKKEEAKKEEEKKEEAADDAAKAADSLAEAVSNVKVSEEEAK